MYKNSSGVLAGNKVNVLQYSMYSGLPISFIRVSQFSTCEISYIFFQIYLKLLFIVQLLSRVRLQLFLTSWTAGHQTSLSFTISWDFLKFKFIESMMSSSHLILCRPLLLLPSIFLSIRVFSNELALHNRWPRDQSFSFSVSPSNE